MRVYIALLVAVVFLLNSNTASAVTRSSPSKLIQATSFEVLDDVHAEKNDARFLRKTDADEIDDLATEERVFSADTVKKVTSWFSSKQRALNLFKKTDEQLAAKGYGAEKLNEAVAKLREKGISEEKLAPFIARADEWSKYWYRTGGKLDPVRK